MQRIIVKYGLALHFAFLAAIPTLCSFLPSSVAVAAIILWLVFFSVEWMFLAPSLRSGETFADARNRVLLAFARDPFFWMSLAAIAYFGIAAFNTSYPELWIPEDHAYRIPQAAVSMLPSAAADAGKQLFTMILAVAVLSLGVRHALGKSSRSFCLVSACCITGVVGVATVVTALLGCMESVVHNNASLLSPKLIGDICAVWLIVSIAAVGTVESFSWHKFGYPALMVAITGNFAALLFFAPPFIVLIFAAVVLIAILVTWLSIMHGSGANALLRGGAVTLLSLGLGFMLVSGLSSARFQVKKIEQLNIENVLDHNYYEKRAILSKGALNIWKNSPRLGCGFGAFGFNVSYAADKEDLDSIPLAHDCVPNGFLQMLSEHGAVGCGVFLMMFGLLFYNYIKSAVVGCSAVLNDSDSPKIMAAFPPLVWVAPFAAIAMLVEMFFTSSHAVAVEGWIAIAFIMALAAGNFAYRARSRSIDVTVNMHGQ